MLGGGLRGRDSRSRGAEEEEGEEQEQQQECGGRERSAAHGRVAPVRVAGLHATRVLTAFVLEVAAVTDAHDLCRPDFWWVRPRPALTRVGRQRAGVQGAGAYHNRLVGVVACTEEIMNMAWVHDTHSGARSP